MATPWGQQLALPSSAAPAGSAEWSELKAPDGRSYYYNSRTNTTTWDKPDALKTPAEIRLAKIAWKEYSTPEGRKYWNNSQTGESVWTMPQEYKDALNGPAKPNGTSTALTLQTFIPAQQTVEDENTPGTEAYINKEEAKKEFVRLLRKTEMEPTSQWNEVLPQIIKNPAFRGVKDPVERKRLFEDYKQTLYKEVEEKEKDRRQRVRQAFMQMCRRHPEIKHYTRWKTARPILQDETDFKAAKDEDERRELFEEFRVEALKEYEDNEYAERKRAMNGFRKILESLQLDPYARWRPTKEIFDRKIRDENRLEELSAMKEVDYLSVFEDYVKELEKKFNDAQQAEKDAKYRAERKNRDAFNALLQDLVKEGIIVERTKWKEVFNLFENDERFLNMLGQSGSTPLELFWDVVEALETEFRLRRDYVLDVLEEKRYEVSETTNYEEFNKLMSSDHRTSVIPPPLLERIFANLVNKSKRHTSSRSRKKSDDFRSVLRHLPEMAHDSKWEDIRPLVEKSEEYLALQSDDERIAVFEKVIRRLKEKREEEKRYREREGSARASKRERDESVHKDSRYDSKSRRRHDDNYEQSRDRSRHRSRERTSQSRDLDYDRDRRVGDHSRGYSRRDELDYDDGRDRSKRRSSDDLRSGERKRSRKEVLDYGEKEDGEVSEEGEIPD